MGNGSGQSVNSSGGVAHPDSPRGGPGPGRGSKPGPLGAGSDGTSGLPDPRSPVGRLIGTAVNFLWSPLNFPVRLLEFNTDKMKYVPTMPGYQLGVHPPVRWAPFTNLVELIFKVDEGFAKRLDIVAFRCRQNVHSEEMWEREPDKEWRKTISGGEEPDDPHEEFLFFSPSIVAFHDSPGFGAQSPSGQFLSFKGDGQLTSKSAQGIYLVQNFEAWIDGQRGDNTWQKASESVLWHSTQAIGGSPGDNPRWASVDEFCEIKLGHIHGPPA